MREDYDVIDAGIHMQEVVLNNDEDGSQGYRKSSIGDGESTSYHPGVTMTRSMNMMNNLKAA